MHLENTRTLVRGSGEGELKHGMKGDKAVLPFFDSCLPRDNSRLKWKGLMPRDMIYPLCMQLLHMIKNSDLGVSVYSKLVPFHTITFHLKRAMME